MAGRCVRLLLPGRGARPALGVDLGDNEAGRLLLDERRGLDREVELLRTEGSSNAPVIAGIRAARAAERVIHSSQRRSIIYNVLAVAAAAAGLVNPLVAAILMPLSSSIVIWNAARVERIIQAEEACVR